MKIKKFNLVDLNNFITGVTPGLVVGVDHKYIYADGKRTDNIESTNVTCVCDGLREVTLIFPPSDELISKIKMEYPFGKALYINEIGVAEDVNISIYDGGLMFKIKMRGL